MGIRESRLAAGLLMCLAWASGPALASATVLATAPVQLPPQNASAPPAVAGSGKAANTGTARFVVVLDAAHGGDDSGAQLNSSGQGGSTAEKTVTLALSVRLRSLLTARGFQVVTTREGNTTLDTNARAQTVNRAVAGAGGAACLSLHATQSGSGIHLFVSSLAPAPVARFLAWRTAQAAYVTRSLKLASVVNSALEHSGGTDSGSGTDFSSDAGQIPVTLARTTLPGIDSMACPALAVEVAPLRSGGDKGVGRNAGSAGAGLGPVTTEVTDSRYQAQIVEALAAALLEWRTDWQTDAGSGRLP